MPRINKPRKGAKKISLSEQDQKKLLLSKLDVDPLDVFMGLRDWSTVMPDAFLIRRSGTRVMSRCRKADKNEIEPLKSVSHFKKRTKITKKDIGQMMTIEEPRRKKKKPHDHFPMPATAKKRKTKKKKKKKDRPPYPTKARTLDGNVVADTASLPITHPSLRHARRRSGQTIIRHIRRKR
ncbi:hypothetical protein TL16_g01746 [Triparma laevis f. inornata]|uniref:Uncharacterized protein n=1 Tax=Triparma laevis f. inornata TaxID=1714386 RepID=A0A9W6ZP06_9STRA|nr:hypothetical protein TL16_g01746 [Triparma laevis f. inornata]